jgi:hypothetical protein
MLPAQFEEITKALLGYKAEEANRILMIGGCELSSVLLTSYVSDAWPLIDMSQQTSCRSYELNFAQVKGQIDH